MDVYSPSTTGAPDSAAKNVSGDVTVDSVRNTLHLLSEGQPPSRSYPVHRPVPIHAQAPDMQHQRLFSDASDDAYDGESDFDDVITDGEGGEDDDDGDTSDGRNTLGRISEASLERIKDGLHQVQKLARDIATETGLSTSQVFDRWMATSQRTHVKRNPWNLYSAYFKGNEAQERARLNDRESNMHHFH